MMDPIGRRDLLRAAALAAGAGPPTKWAGGWAGQRSGRGAPPAVNEAVADTRRRTGIAAPTVPVVISSANVVRAPDGTMTQGGIRCCTRAMEILKAAGDTLDAVVAGVNLVEDDPNDTSVGLGGLPNEEGVVELDASVMHGPTRRAGAVASLRSIRNPSKVARLVMERTDHMLLVGEGALRFALRQGFKKEELLTEASRKAWLRWREELNPNDNWGPSPHRPAPARDPKQERRRTKSEHEASAAAAPATALERWVEEVLRDRPTGTINCLAVDEKGDISGATSTSGLAWKMPGRVGDSPLIGCGLYVDNEVGAAGSTGRGEECIFITGAHTVVANMARGMTPGEAALDAVKRVAARYDNDRRELQRISIDFYAVNKRGEYGAATLWKGRRFVVHDGRQARLLDAVYLFER